MFYLNSEMASLTDARDTTSAKTESTIYLILVDKEIKARIIGHMTGEQLHQTISILVLNKLNLIFLRQEAIIFVRNSR